MRIARQRTRLRCVTLAEWDNCKFECLICKRRGHLFFGRRRQTILVRTNRVGGITRNMPQRVEVEPNPNPLSIGHPRKLYYHDYPVCGICGRCTCSREKVVWFSKRRCHALRTWAPPVNQNMLSTRLRDKLLKC